MVEAPETPMEQQESMVVESVPEAPAETPMDVAEPTDALVESVSMDTEDQVDECDKEVSPIAETAIAEVTEEPAVPEDPIETSETVEKPVETAEPSEVPAEQVPIESENLLKVDGGELKATEVSDGQPVVKRRRRRNKENS